MEQDDLRVAQLLAGAVQQQPPAVQQLHLLRLLEEVGGGVAESGGEGTGQFLSFRSLIPYTGFF